MWFHNFADAVWYSRWLIGFSLLVLVVLVVCDRVSARRWRQ